MAILRPMRGMTPDEIALLLTLMHRWFFSLLSPPLAFGFGGRGRINADGGTAQNAQERRLGG
jgi:hypothetical protein